MLYSTPYEAEREGFISAANDLVSQVEVQRRCNVEVKSPSATFYIDCQSLIVSLQRAEVCTQRDEEVMLALRRVTAVCSSVHLQHLRSHKGIEQNERVDALAKEAVRSQQLHRDVDIGKRRLGAGEVKTHVREETKNARDRIILEKAQHKPGDEKYSARTVEYCKIIGTTEYGTLRRLKFFKCSMPRKFGVIGVQLAAGYCPAIYDGNIEFEKIHKGEYDCPECGVKLDAAHFLLHCRRNAVAIDKVKSRLRINNGDGEGESVRKILQSDYFADFVKETIFDRSNESTRDDCSEENLNLN